MEGEGRRERWGGETGETERVGGGNGEGCVRRRFLRGMMVVIE